MPAVRLMERIVAGLRINKATAVSNARPVPSVGISPNPCLCPLLSDLRRNALRSSVFSDSERLREAHHRGPTQTSRLTAAATASG